MTLVSLVRSAVIIDPRYLNILIKCILFPNIILLGMSSLAWAILWDGDMYIDSVLDFTFSDQRCIQRPNYMSKLWQCSYLV